jgi:hypothetical protein
MLGLAGMGCSMSELFSTGEDLKDINSFNKSILEKVSILEHLEEDEKKGIYSIIDGLATKQRLKQTLSNALAF